MIGGVYNYRYKKGRVRSCLKTLLLYEGEFY